MASVFGHGILSLTVGKMFPKRIQSAGLFSLGAALSILPDADIIAFNFGIPYSHILGHRGFTHSFSFALVIALLAHYIFYRKKSKLDGNASLRKLYLFICCASHGVLDAMTSGGRGVALFFPIYNDRIFLPFRPILVSPLGASNFFSSWGFNVLISEFIWIGMPCLIVLAIVKLISK